MSNLFASEFPQLPEPPPKQVAFENALTRWAVVGLPVVIVGKVLGLLAVVAILIACNFNVLTWIE